MDFLKPKKGIQLQHAEVRFYYALYFGALIGIPIHLLVSIFFYSNDVFVLSALNLFGALYYCFLFYLVQSFKLKRAYWLSLFEIILVCFLDTYYVGWEAGFHYYILIFLPVFFLYSHWKIAHIFIATSTVFVGYLGSFLIKSFDAPIYVLPENICFIVNLANFSGAFAAFTGVILFFNSAIVEVQNAFITSNKELSKGNEEKKILLKEIHHRVKNNLHVVNSILELQVMEVTDSKIRSYLQDAQRRIITMATIHEKMYGSENLKYISVKGYFESFVRDLKAIYDPQGKVNVKMSIDDIQMDLDTLAPLAFLFNEIMTNSYKHAFNPNQSETPEINCSLNLSGNRVYMVMSDNGSGFEEKLKESETSIGVDLIYAFAEELNAQISRTTQHGTSYRFDFNKQLILPHIDNKHE